MKTEFTVNTREFNAAVKDIAKAKGVSVLDAIKGEGAAAASKASSFTKQAKPKDVLEDAKRFFVAKRFDVQDGHITTNSGARGGLKGKQWFIFTNHISGKIIKLDLDKSYHPATEAWISNKIDSAAKAQKRRVGRLAKKQKEKARLAKQSFELTSKKLGGPTKSAPMKARALTANGKQFVPDENVRIKTDNNGKGIIITNRSPSANNRNAKGGVAMQRALKGRVKFFVKSMKDGRFEDYRRASQKWGAVKVS